MKLRHIILFCLLCITANSYRVSGAEDPLKNLLEKLERYRTDYPKEKVHLHTDKPYYAIGDTIWFKSYVVQSERNQLSALSKILHVELINEKDSIKKSLALPVASGLAWGDFTLSDSLPEGNYRIRAYTNWMRNFDDAYFFDKTIKIGNSLSSQVVSNVVYNFSKVGVRENVTALISFKTLKGNLLKGKEVSYEVQLDHRNILKGSGKTDSLGNILINFTNAQPFILKSGKINTKLKVDDKTSVTKTFPVKATSNNIDVQFFPESGSLVTNIRSRVAFKAVADDGLSRGIFGYVQNSNGEKITEFKSNMLGMGSFFLTPLAGQNYKAIVKFQDGSEKTLALPTPKAEGITLTVASSTSENVTVKVSSTITNESPEAELFLVAQSNGVVHYVGKNKFNNAAFSTTISRNRLPAGVIQFTLFNSTFQPLAERLIFIRQTNQLTANISTNKQNYNPRERVTLMLNTTDSAGKASKGAFSLSVIDESQIPFDDVNEITILSNLLLTSELKGYIEKPNYYFTEVSDAKNEALDHLMLTQGWKKLEWQKILAGSFPQVIYKPEQSLTLSGKVSSPNGSAVSGGRVSVLSSGGTGLMLDTLTDAQGRFRFENLQYNDSTSFIIQARNAKGKKNVFIDLDRLPPQLVSKNRHAADVEINVNQSLLPYLQYRNEQFEQMKKAGLLRRSITLAEVKITETKPKVKNSSNLNGAGNADAVLVAKDLLDCQNLAFCLQGRVAGLVIQNGIPYLTRSMFGSFSGPVPMQLIVDGMYMEPSYLSVIAPTDVETIEILKSIGNTAIYGMRGGGGVLIITTKRGEPNMSPRSMASGIAAYSPKGYYMSRQFYSPKYDAPEQNSALPDLRNTIFWAPNLITEEGKATVEFFTADKRGIYKAVIEGIDLNGFVTRQVHRFSVE